MNLFKSDNKNLKMVALNDPPPWDPIQIELNLKNNEIIITKVTKNTHHMQCSAEEAFLPVINYM